MDIKTIEGFLQNYGWSYEIHEDNSLLTGFVSDNISFLIKIQVSFPWLRLQIPAFLPIPDVSEDLRLQLYSKLLQINDEIRMVRFAIDKHSHISLMIDLFVGEESGVGFSDFEVALDMLSYAADTTFAYLNELMGVEVD